LRRNRIVLPLRLCDLVLGDARNKKAFSQKLTKGYTGVKKPFTLVRSRFFTNTTGGIRTTHS
jgi:hypothetical protein